jgi:hypothetical protein
MAELKAAICSKILTVIPSVIWRYNLVALTYSQNMTISVITLVRLYTLSSAVPTGWISVKFDTGDLWKSVRTQIWLKLVKNVGHLIDISMHFIVASDIKWPYKHSWVQQYQNVSLAEQV